MAEVEPRRSRTRGLDEIKHRIGDIEIDILARLGQGRPVRILELGCGYGSVLMELYAKYGDEVELHGVNDREDGGNWDIFQRNAVDRGIFTQEQVTELDPVQVHIFDVSNPFPLDSDYFDIIIMQVAFFFFADKINCLEECHRVLNNDGVARLHIWVTRKNLPADKPVALIIRNEGREVDFWDYIAPFENLEQRMLPQRRKPAWYKRLLGSGETKMRSYLEMRKSPGFNFGLKMVDSIDYFPLTGSVHGFQCIYETVDPNRSGSESSSK